VLRAKRDPKSHVLAQGEETVQLGVVDHFAVDDRSWRPYAVLVATEPVGNAVGHARTSCRLGIRLDGLAGAIATTITAGDPSGWPAARPAPPIMACS
jgi:hypothetical protein